MEIVVDGGAALVAPGTRWVRCDGGPGRAPARPGGAVTDGQTDPTVPCGPQVLDRIAALCSGDLVEVTNVLLGTARRPRPSTRTAADPRERRRDGSASAADGRATGGRRTIGRRERAVAEALTTMLRTGGLSTVYQPIVRLADGALVAAEALARFPGPVARSPERWFGAAHDLRLGLELELLAARTALAGHDRLPPGIALAVNASPLALELPDFVALLAAHAPRLVLELTERHPVLDYGRLAATLEPLRAAGLVVAVDDAGAGFASLRHILQIRPDVIKLDKALISGIDRDPRRRKLAAALVTFAEELGAVLVAEGIEHVGERRAAQALGIAFGQGFGIARPRAPQRVLDRYPDGDAPA